MNTPNLAGEVRIDALRGVLRPSARSPRPIHHPETRPGGRFGGGR
jgi:hypothetical protein